MAKSKVFLLDTHVFLWWHHQSRRLSKRVRNVVADPDSQVFLSTVSGWEIAIKSQAGKLRVKVDLDELEQKSCLQLLPVRWEHVLKYQDLPLHHKDPFDRMLIAQAQVENMVLVTVDKKIHKYQVKTLE